MLKVGDVIYDHENREYEIIEPIGKGGMGYVLLVERKEDKVQFAVKTLSIFINGDRDHRALLNEGKAAETITHNNVIKYIYFHDGDRYPNLPPYIIMELAKDGTLQDILNEHIKSNDYFNQVSLLNLFLELVDGIEAINKTLVHRDLKPANILFKGKTLKISDFGISKINGDPTRSKSFKGSGTLPYCAPEIFLNGMNSIAMDMYSMGIIFYFLATLKHPYELDQEIKNEDGRKNAHLYKIPKYEQSLNKNLSRKVFAIIEKMMEKKPEKRFQSWQEVRTEIESIDTLQSATHSGAIEKMINKNLEKKTLEKEREMEITRKEEHEALKREMVVYQFLSDIIGPIEKFILEFNLANPSIEDQIKIQETKRPGFPGIDKIFEVIGPKLLSKVSIYIHGVKDDDCVTYERNRYSGAPIERKDKPLLNYKEVMAWGAIEESNRGRGLNLVLVKSDTSEYGDWFILKNKESPLAQTRGKRPEPFAFTLEEMRNELKKINALHIYSSQVLAFHPNEIISFISDL